MADTGHVAVVAHDGSEYARTVGGVANDAPRERAAQAFYATHGDNYDFLVVFPAFPTDLAPGLPGHALGLHTLVRNEVAGTGQPLPFDLGGAFGSPARLKAYLDVASLVPGVGDGSVATALDVIAHETAHQWSGRARYRDAAGQLRTDLLGMEGAHWSAFLDSQASVLFGSAWVDQGSGTFVAKESEKRYSDLDLYLMGFLSAGEVAPVRLLRPTGATTLSAGDLPPTDGTTLAANAESVSIQQIISAMGPRVPAAGAAQQAFRSAFVILTAPGQSPTPEQVAFVDGVRRQWANAFFYLTRGRGVMETDLVEVPPEPVAQSPSVAAGLDYLLAAQQPSGLWADPGALAARDTELALEALALFGNDARAPGALARGGAALPAAPSDGVDLAARRLLGGYASRASLGALPSDFQALVNSARAASGGVGYAPGHLPSVTATALAGRALAADGASRATLAPLVAYLLAQQKGDGGWASGAAEPSQIGPTAEVLRLLALAEPSPEVTQAASAGVAWLFSRQQPDGTFQDDVPSPAASAEAVLGLLAWNALPGPEANRAALALLAQQRTDGSWGGEVAATAEALQALRAVLAPNLALPANQIVLSASEVTEGEAVSVSLSVQNLGLTDVTHVPVQAFDSNGVAFGPARDVAFVAAGQSASATLVLDTSGHGGSTQVFVVVDPDGTFDEVRRDDNRAALTLKVVPPPAIADPYVRQGSVAALPASISHLPTALSVSAVVGNLGLQDAAGVLVQLELDGVVASSTTVDLPARSSRTVTLAGTVRTAPSDPVAVVRVNPAGTVVEASSANNLAAVTVPVTRAVDLSVSSLALSPASATQGQDVTISYTVSNTSTLDVAAVPVLVSVRDASGAVVASLPAATLAVASGATASQSAHYRANVAGALVVEVSAPVAGDPTPADNTARSALPVAPSPLVNLVVRPGDLTLSPAPPLQGSATTVTALVRNTGGSAAGAFSVDLYLGDPAQGGTRLGRTTVPSLAPGATAPVGAAFTPATADPGEVVAVLDPDGSITEFDESDNQSVLAFTPRSLPDLALSSADVTVDPAFPRAGQTAQVTVSVLNRGGQDAAAAPIALYLGDPASGGTLIGSGTLPLLAAGARGQVTLPWPVGSADGLKLLVATVNADRSVVEGDYGNDRAEVRVTVQSSALSLSEPYFSPNGDGVKDATEIHYALAQAAPVSAAVIDRHGSTVRTLTAPAASAGVLTWDGLDDQGRRVRDDPYQIRVSYGPPGQQTDLGTLTATLDTNRFQLADQGGQVSVVDLDLSANLASFVPTAMVPTPDGRGVIFEAAPPDPTCTGPLNNCFIDGIYSQAIDGSPVVRLSPIGFENPISRFGGRLALAPDGDTLFYRSFRPLSGGGSGYAIRRLSISAQSVSTVLELPPSVARLDNDAELLVTSDGRRLLFVTNDGQTGRQRLEIADVTGANRRVLVTLSGSSVLAEFLPSPNADLYSYLLKDGSLWVAPIAGGSSTQLLAPGSVGTKNPFLSNSETRNHKHAWLSEERIAYLATNGPHSSSDRPTCEAVACNGVTACGGGVTVPCTAFDSAGISTVDVPAAGAHTVFAVTDTSLYKLPSGALGADPFGEKVAFLYSPATSSFTGLWEADVTSGGARALYSAPGTSLQRLATSPAGTFALVNESTRFRAITTDANLLVRLTATRPAGAGSISFRGTVSDANLEAYSLAVGPYGGSAPTVIFQDRAAAHDALITQWVPPAPGLYTAVLTAVDRAGNTTSRSATFAWSNAPLLANVTVSPKYISPNGDGVQDAATVQYSVSQPLTTEFTVSDASGRAVRHLAETRTSPGTYAFVWDGTDDDGRTVADGRYTIAAEGARVDVVVDTRPPTLTFALDLGYYALGQSQVRQEFLLASVQGRETVDGGAVQVPTVLANEFWAAQDDNLDTGALQQADPGSDAFTDLQLAQGLHQGPVGEARAHLYRARATDLAGNAALTSAQAHAERIFVVAAGPAPLLQGRGSVEVGGATLPRIDLLKPVNDTAGPGSIDVDPGPLAFALASSVGADLVSYRLRYRLQGAASFVDQAVTTPFPGIVAWDASALAPAAYEMELSATDSRGLTYATTLLSTVKGSPPPGTCSASWNVGVCFEAASAVLSLEAQSSQRVGHPEDVVDRGRVDFIPLGSSIPEASGDLTATTVAPQACAPGSCACPVVANLPADVRALRGCVYEVALHGKTAGGQAVEFTPHPVVNVCSVGLAGTRLDGSAAWITLSSSLRKAATSIAVYSAEANGRWQLLTGAAPFSGLSQEIGIPASSFGHCGAQALRVVATLADGTTIDSLTEDQDPQRPRCEQAPSLDIPCGSLAIAQVTPDPAPALCAPHSPTYDVVVHAAGPSGEQVASVEAEAVPFAGGPALALPVAPFAPQALVDAHASFSTSSLPEGAYHLRARATTDQGTHLAADWSAPILVDHTPPVASLSAPTGGLVCPALASGPGGQTLRLLPVSGSVSDAHLTGYAVLLAPPGQPASPVATAAVSAPVSGLLAQVDVTSVPSGDYQLSLAATDVSGGSACSAPATVHLQGPLSVDGARAEPAVFSPDGDGSADQVVIAATISNAATVSLGLLGLDGSVTPVGQSSFVAGALSLTWDGTAGGSRLADGDYTLVLDASDPCGQRASANVPVRLDTRAPVARIDLPAAGDAVGASILVRGEATDLDLDRYELALGAGPDPTTFTTVFTSRSPATGDLGAVPTAGLAAGTYTLRLTAFDSVGHSSEARVVVDVLPGQLISAAGVAPAAISPNGDGVLDLATATVELLQPATLTAEVLDANGAVVASLASGTTRPGGASTFALDAVSLTGVADGDLSVRFTATASPGTETALAPLVLDRAAPEVSVTSPVAGQTVRSATSVSLSITDPHLTAWTVSHVGPDGVPHALASGTAPLAGHLADLGQLAEGDHLLVVHAEDVAGNARDTSVAFHSDSSAPTVSLSSPADGAFVSGRSGPVPVVASASDLDVARVQLAVTRSGATSALFDGPALPPGGKLLDWDVSALADGPATLSLSVTDRAGNAGTAQALVTLDSTPPVARLDHPRGEAVRAGASFTGAATDVNLARYTVAIAPGASPADSAFVTLLTGTAPVGGGALAPLASVPADGTYTARLTVTDRAGNTTEDRSVFTVDSTPPGGPTGLTATVQRPNSVALSWAASPDPDVAGYLVLRASGPGSPAALPGGPVAGTGFTDTGLADGTYTYRVQAVDRAGNVGAASNAASATVDQTPPLAAIAAPLAGSVVSGQLVVRGTAYSADFAGYRLEVGAGASPGAYTLVSQSTQSVQGGALGTLDTAALGPVATLRLTAQDQAGNAAVATTTFTVDNAPPAAPVLLSATPSGTSVSVRWQANADPDLLGYLVYRNGAVANAPADADLSNLRRYVLSRVTSYTDLGLADGTWSYQVQAVDQAMNLSPLSNAIAVALDNRAPSARIVSPASASHVSGPFQVVIDSADQDLAQVQLYARTSSAAPFAPLGAPLTRFPYLQTVDPAALGGRVIELQAVATDLAGRADPAPGSTVVLVDQSVAAPALTALVNQSQVSLAWTGSAAVFVAYRDGVAVGTTSTHPAGTISTASGENASVAYDGIQFGSRYMPGSLPQVVQIDLAATTLVDAISPFFNDDATAELSVLVGGVWVPLGTQKFFGFSDTPVTISPPLPVSAVRVKITNLSIGFGGLNEVKINALPATSGNSALDTAVTIGSHRYVVKAFDPFGASASSVPASALIYAPLLASAPAVVADSPLHVTGSGATAGASVQIAGGAQPATATADAQGTFSADVALTPGSNVLTAQATDSAGNVSLRSAPASVLYDPRPAVTPALSVSGVAGASVSLALSLGDTTNVASLRLSRDGQPVATLAASAAAYTDTGLRNGTYTYTLAAVNSHGFTGPTSGPVSATVAAPVPGAPSGLVVSAPASGAELDLAWAAPAGGTSAYQIERATDPAGPFGVVASGLAALTYRDIGLANSTAYSYRVRAADALGNLGPPSNVATGTPHDTIAPASPVLDRPTVAGKPVTVASVSTDVGGRAEPASLVELFANGVSRGTTRAGALAATSTAIATTFPATGSFTLSDDGSAQSYDYSTASGALGIAVENTSDGGIRSFSVPGAYLSSGPTLSSNGSQVAFVANTGRPAVYLGDVTSGTLRPIVNDTGLYEGSLSWSADGRSIAMYTIRLSDFRSVPGIWDGTSFRTFDLGSSISSAAYVGRTLVVQLGTDLLTLDTATGATSPLASGIDTTFVTGPFLLALRGSDLYRIDVPSGASTLLVRAPSGLNTPVLDARGQRLAYLEGGAQTLALVDLATGAVSRFQSIAGGLQWGASDRLVYVDSSSGPQELRFGGPFTFPGQALGSGSTLFTATATDGASNVSAPSAAIEVVRSGAYADLAVSIAVSPAAPVANAPATAQVTVSNRGAAAASGVVVQAQLLASDGSIRALPSATLASLAAGASVTLPFGLDLTGLSGPQTLTAVVDPTGTVPDADRSNNAASLNFDVGQSGVLSLSLAVAPSSTGPAGAFTATVGLSNTGADQSVSVRVTLTDPLGALAASGGLDEVFAPLASGSQVGFTRSLPAAGLLAGDYLVVAEAFSGGVSIARQQRTVTIEADRSATLSLAPLQAAFVAGQAAGFDARVANTSQNSLLTGASLVVEARDDAGALAGSATLPVPTLAQGGSASLSPSLSGLPQGVYAVHGEVRSGGSALASADVTVQVVGQALLTGSLAVVGAGDPPAVPSGQDAQVSGTVQNVGTAAASSVVLRAVVLDPATSAQVAQVEAQLGALAPGAQAGVTLAVPTAALAHQVYAVALVAEHDGGLLETLATGRFRVADSRPPVLTLLNLADGMFVRTSAFLQVRAQDDDTGTAGVRVSVDGQGPSELLLDSGGALDGIWIASLPLGGEGPHALRIWAVDAEGNDGNASPSAGDPLVLTLLTDTVPPAVSITGVADGALVGGPVTPAATVTEANLFSLALTLDGQPFTAGSIVASDGTHLLVAQATDQAGNVGLATAHFTIDQAAPVIAIGGVADGLVTTQDVAPAVTVTDAHLTTWSSSLDGLPFMPGQVVHEEGPHLLAVEASDALGHSASAQVAFTIDRTPPRITLGGFTDGVLVNTPVIPTYQVTDATALSVQATLDGRPFTSGTAVADEGLHTLAVSATDAAGLHANASGSFRIDRTAPILTLAGVADGQVLNMPQVSVTATAADVSPVTVRLKLNGQAYASGTAITAEGDYDLLATATDAAGNAASPVSLHFAIDRTAPVISFTGVADGTTYPGPVTPVLQVLDAHPGTNSATLDSAPFQSGTVVSQAGDHVLRASATDRAGLTATTTVRFTISGSQQSVDKRLAAGFPRVLALATAGQSALSAGNLSRVTSFLTGALGGPADVFTLAPDRAAFLGAMRSGQYNVLLLISLPRSCPTGPQGQGQRCSASPSDAAAGDDLLREATELVHLGQVGLVSVRARPENIPALREVLGADIHGLSQASAVHVGPPLAPLADLQLGSRSVSLDLLQATQAAAYVGTGAKEVAASTYGFGRGQSALLGFDPSTAAAASDAATALRRAVAWVTPTHDTHAPLSVAAVEIHVTASGGLVQDAVTEAIPAPLFALRSAPQASGPGSGQSLSWDVLIGANDSQVLRYLVQLPDQAGAFTVTTSVAEVSGGSPQPVGSYPLALAVADTGAGLMARAQQAAAALPPRGPDAVRRIRIMTLLSGVQGRTVSSRADAERNLSDLLQAVDDARQLSSVSPEPVRYALDDLVRYWEARWFQL